MIKKCFKNLQAKKKERKQISELMFHDKPLSIFYVLPATPLNIQLYDVHKSCFSSDSTAKRQNFILDLHYVCILYQVSNLWLHYFKNEKYCKNFVMILSYQFTSVKVSYLRRKVLKMKQKDIKIKTSNIKLCKKLDNFDRTNYHRWYVKSRATSTASIYGNKLTIISIKSVFTWQ